jgi:hypothetical protein
VELAAWIWEHNPTRCSFLITRALVERLLRNEHTRSGFPTLAGRRVVRTGLRWPR